MKCPHCEYFDKEIDGDDGDFYRLPIKMEREESYRTEQRCLYACPKCGKTFIDVRF